MKRGMIDFWVGVFVIIGIGCVIFLSLKVANFNTAAITESTYSLNADFNNIGSLKSNAPVKVSGFTVGRVRSISLDSKSYQARIVMDINKNYKFSCDTAAQILTTGLLGEQYIGLQSGAASDDLKDGDMITITSSALVLEQLIGKFMTNITTK